MEWTGNRSLSLETWVLSSGPATKTCDDLEWFTPSDWPKSKNGPITYSKCISAGRDQHASEMGSERQVDTVDLRVTVVGKAWGCESGDCA